MSTTHDANEFMGDPRAPTGFLSPLPAVWNGGISDEVAGALEATTRYDEKHNLPKATSYEKAIRSLAGKWSTAWDRGLGAASELDTAIKRGKPGRPSGVGLLVSEAGEPDGQRQVPTWLLAVLLPIAWYIETQVHPAGWINLGLGLATTANLALITPTVQIGTAHFAGRGLKRRNLAQSFRVELPDWEPRVNLLFIVIGVGLAAYTGVVRTLQAGLFAGLLLASISLVTWLVAMVISAGHYAPAVHAAKKRAREIRQLTKKVQRTQANLNKREQKHAGMVKSRRQLAGSRVDAFTLDMGVAGAQHTAVHGTVPVMPPDPKWVVDERRWMDTSIPLDDDFLPKHLRKKSE